MSKKKKSATEKKSHKNNFFNEHQNSKIYYKNGLADWGGGGPGAGGPWVPGGLGGRAHARHGYPPPSLLYKCTVAKLGSKAGNFLSGKREGGERY